MKNQNVVNNEPVVPKSKSPGNGRGYIGGILNEGPPVNIDEIFEEQSDAETEMCPQCHEEISPLLIHCPLCGYCLTCNF